MNFLHAGESTSDSSSTTKHRKKVALKQGKGLVEWIRLSNSGRLSNYGCQESVDHNELSKHCSREDCWILLFDTVFDVTKYLDFHPGGADELMRAAGTDASLLFDENHRWINYKGMLKSCAIGPFIGDRKKLRIPNEAIK